MLSPARQLGIATGILAPGPRNAITDVPGVAVGHLTLQRQASATGVTAIIPASGNLFQNKVRAGVDIINGFGKSVGLMQVTELGTLETPILLTNTFAVGACSEALIQHAVAANPTIGRDTCTVNPLVFECNDGAINDIQDMVITSADALQAMATATTETVAQGAIGAGTGMTCFGFKGGIGTASRRFGINDMAWTFGTLVLANFGNMGDLVLPDGRRPHVPAKAETEKGSVIVIMATNLPLGDRQLRRVARRAAAGLARLGAFWGNGSGDIALCFTTADRVAHNPGDVFHAIQTLSEDLIDLPFRAATETTQEAVLNALCTAPSTTGRDGRHFPALSDWLRSNPSGPLP